MKKRIQVILIALVMGAWLLSGCGAAFSFAKRPSGPAIKGTTTVYLSEMTYNGLMVEGRTEKQWRDQKRQEWEAKGETEKADKSDSSWAADKEKWKGKISASLGKQLSNASIALKPLASTETPASGIVITTNMNFIRPGWRDSEAKVRITVAQANAPGEVLVTEFE